MAFADPGTGRSVHAGLPTGSRMRVTAGEAWSKGDLVGIDGAGAWKKANGTSGSVIQPRAVACHDAASGMVDAEVSDVATVWGYTGATVGDQLIVDTTAGKARLSSAAGGGESNKIVGFIFKVDATLGGFAKFHVNARPDSTV